VLKGNKRFSRIKDITSFDRNFKEIPWHSRMSSNLNPDHIRKSVWSMIHQNCEEPVHWWLVKAMKMLLEQMKRQREE